MRIVRLLLFSFDCWASESVIEVQDAIAVSPIFHLLQLVRLQMRTPVRLPDGFPISGGWIISSSTSPSTGHRTRHW